MIVIIDYEAGNTCSVMNALKRLDVDYKLSSSKSEIQAAEKVIFPGVGHAGAAMEALKRSSLDTLISELSQPVLGICVGMQLMCSGSEEGNSEGLGIIDARVKKFDEKIGIKVPHMGWNKLHAKKADPIWEGIDANSYLYFVHSYYVPLHEATIGACEYGHSFSAAIRKDNFWGIQFHAEKSGDIGSILLNNFVNGSLE
ncbi:MAG: glutamine amidotransferase [Saprospiraceae bacterium]|jgi:glutamine amidotransferase